MTVVRSSAALATLTVNPSDFDLVMELLAKALPFQVSIVSSKATKTPTLQLGPDHAAVLHQRAAILRALAQLALSSGLYLGSHSGFIRADIHAWMSVADSVRTGAAVPSELEEHLMNHSFLCDTAEPTLADWDLAAVLLQAKVTHGPNVTRWLRQCHVSLDEACRSIGRTCPLPAPPSVATPVPVFFSGAEDATSILKTTKVVGMKETGTTKQDLPAKAQQQQQQLKKEKQQKQQQQPTQQEDLDTITIAALDIRVGKIVKVWNHPEAEKLFCEEIDLGTETRQIASGLRPFYKAEELQDKHVLVLCNLKKRNLVGFPSHGMVLCASNEDHTAVELVSPSSGTPLGERVVFEGIKGEPEPENKVAKKKIFEKLAPDLKTDENGIVVWKSLKATTSAGLVHAHNGMPNAQVA